MFKEDGTIMHFKQPKGELFSPELWWFAPHNWDGPWHATLGRPSALSRIGFSKIVIYVYSASCIPVQHLCCERNRRGQV